jgi:putative component of membrane protein insertase Oxa1/YidC/SpoIIIJ protein YidD
MKKHILIFFLIILRLNADPWGKDADLANPSLSTCQSPSVDSPSWITQMGITAIRFHQEVISPADGPRSHFIPSSSQYTLEAMQKYGFLKGFTIGCDRLMRENNDPWVYRTIVDPNGYLMKWDPVK